MPIPNDNFNRDTDFSSSETPHQNPPSVLDQRGQVVLGIGNDAHWDVIKSPKRLRVLEGIRQLGDTAVSELTGHIGEPEKALYYHIKNLLGAGLIEERGTKETGAPRESIVYRSLLIDCMVPFTCNSKNKREVMRLQQARDRWAKLMVDSYHHSRLLNMEVPEQRRSMCMMNWLMVTTEQKERIETLFEELRIAIEDAQMSEPRQDTDRTPMQYSLWMVDDSAGTGPLPALRPFRER